MPNHACLYRKPLTRSAVYSLHTHDMRVDAWECVLHDVRAAGMLVV